MPAGVTQYKSATNLVWVVGRTYTTGTPEDYAKAHAFQDKLSLVPLSAYGKDYAPPKGKVDDRVRGTVRALGWRIRSAPVIGTRAHHAGTIEPSFQFFPFRWNELLRNAVRRRLVPATPLVLAWAQGGRSRDRSMRLLRTAARHLPCVHVWGHAADVERFGMWDALGEMLAAAAAMRLVPVTNGELAGALRPGG